MCTVIGFMTKRWWWWSYSIKYTCHFVPRMDVSGSGSTYVSTYVRMYISFMRNVGVHNTKNESPLSNSPSYMTFHWIELNWIPLNSNSIKLNSIPINRKNRNSNQKENHHHQWKTNKWAKVYQKRLPTMHNYVLVGNDWRHHRIVLATNFYRS